MKSILTALVPPEKALCRRFSYISVPVMKQHGQGHLEEEVFNWTWRFSVLEYVMAEQRYGGRNICEFTSWSTSKRQRGYTGDGASLLKPQSSPGTHLLQSHTSQCFPRNSVSWDQVFKHTESVGAILIQTATNSLSSDFIRCQCYTTRRQWKAEN